MKPLLMVLILVIAIVIVLAGMKSGEDEVRSWADKNGHAIKSIETHMTIFGSPFFYLNDGSYIYEVDMVNGDKWWVRTSLFGNDYIKDENRQK